MGWDREELQIFGHVSRHNSPQDAEDDALWADLVKRVREVIDDPRYESLNIITNGTIED